MILGTSSLIGAEDLFDPTDSAVAGGRAGGGKYRPATPAPLSREQTENYL